MTNFVTVANFTGDRNIPVNDKYLTDFNNFITKYQKEILIKLLGYDLYLAFEAGLAVEPTPDSKWTNLRDGSTYVVSGINHQNPGLIDIVAYYVYCKHVSTNFEQYSALGVYASNVEGGTVVSPENKITSGWNNMLNYYYMVYDFISNNETDYPNWDFTTLKMMTYGF